MLQNNPLLAQLKQQIREQLPKKEGIVRASDRGFGFLEVENQERFFIPPPYMKKVMHGDRVRAVVRVENEREVAEPESLVQPFLQRFIGRVRRVKGRVMIEPDHPMIKDAYRAKFIQGLKVGEFQEGDWVVARLEQHALEKQYFNVEVLQWVARSDDPVAPWRVILARHELAHDDLPPADSIEPQTSAYEDMSHIPFVTIDSTSTQDMDDAIAIESAEAGWWLTIAVADPTAYIPENSEIEQAAKDRGFTLYLPNQNIPMIPRNLSDDLCSLWADKKRPAICCKMWVNHDGSLDEKQTTFRLAWIQVAHKLNYEQVTDFLEEKNKTNVPETTETMLKTLAEFAARRSQWREAHQVVFVDRPDFVFEVDDAGKVTHLRREVRRISNRIVEETMIAANISGGYFLARNLNVGLFSTHAGVDAEQLETIQALLTVHLPEFAQQDLTDLDVFCALQRRLQEEDCTWLNHRLRRLQSFAILSTQSKPHFAMGLRYYATWTSPIRKYSDLLNHRLIKAHLTQQSIESSLFDDALLTHLGECKRTHRTAEREINDWLYIQYLQPFVKNQQLFKAEVIDVTRGGLRVRLLENGANAFMPLRSLKLDKKRLNVQADEGTFSIDKQCFAKLGDVIPVSITQLNADTRSVTVQYQGQLPS